MAVRLTTFTINSSKPIDQTTRKDILVVQRDRNAKVGKDAQADWVGVCEPYCNVEINKRGFGLLEFASFNVT